MATVLELPGTPEPAPENNFPDLFGVEEPSSPPPEPESGSSPPAPDSGNPNLTETPVAKKRGRPPKSATGNQSGNPVPAPPPPPGTPLKKSTGGAGAGSTTEILAKEMKAQLAVLPQPPVPVLGGTLFADINSKNGVESALKGWAYWHDTDAQYPNRLRVYCYRMYPHTVPTEGPKSEIVYGFPDYQYVAGDFGNLRHFVLSRWGSGNYKFIFKDQISGGTPLFTWLLNGIWDSAFPPNIPWEMIDTGHRNNQSILPELMPRLRNLNTNEEEEMLAREFNREPNPGMGGGAGSSPSTAATNAAMGVASATVAPLTETIRDLVTANRANQPDISAVAAGVGEAYSRVVETLISESKAQRDAANPQEQIKSIIEIAKTLAPPPPPPVDGLIDRVLEAQREANQTTVAMLQAQLADTRNQLLEIQREHREARHGNGNGVGNPGDGTPNDPLAAIERILEMKKRLDSLTGEPEAESGTGNPAPAPGTGGGDTGLAAILKTVLPMLTPILAPLAQMGAQYMMRQMAAPPAGAMGAMGGMGNPAPAPGAPAHNINAPYPEQAATTQPNPQAAQNQNPNPHAQEANTMIDPTRMFLAAIRQPLMQHLQRQDGAGFAVWLINGFDITTYERLYPLGRDGILALLQAHAPEIYAQITVPDVNMPGAVQPMTSALEFLDAFLDRDRVMRLHRGEDDGEGDDYELLAEASESQTVPHPAAPAPAGTGTGTGPGTGTQSPARKPIVGGGNIVGR